MIQITLSQIAADGANSRVREMSGIECSSKEYQQMAVVATLEINSTQVWDFIQKPNFKFSDF